MPDSREKTWHREARRVVEFYLMAKDRQIRHDFAVEYPTEFIRKHKFPISKFPGHEFDICTNRLELIEIDDLGQHSHKQQIIADHLVNDYVENHLKGWKLYRLLKEEIVNRRGHIENLDNVHSYLQENLILK